MTGDHGGLATASAKGGRHAIFDVYVSRLRSRPVELTGKGLRHTGYRGTGRAVGVVLDLMDRPRCSCAPCVWIALRGY